MTRIVGRTDPGARGGPNQDAIGWDEARQFALVADGVGGYSGGEVASRLVKETMLDCAAAGNLDAAVLRAHESIVQAAQKDASLAMMASTVISMQITERRCAVVWVGDSRGYLWRENALRPLTRDHSVIEILRDADHLSETAMRSHPLRHEVLQTLGRNQPAISSEIAPLRRGDWLLLCSDGLSGELRDGEIADVLRQNRSLEGAADALIAAALASGGNDNVSVVLMDYDGPSSPEFSWWRGDRAVLYASALGGVALALAVAIAFWFKDRH
jgi:serine/threonine protein phosphatase PrpC